MSVKHIVLIDALDAAVSVIDMLHILPAFQLWHGMTMDAVFVRGV